MTGIRDKNFNHTNTHITRTYIYILRLVIITKKKKKTEMAKDVLLSTFSVLKTFFSWKTYSLENECYDLFLPISDRH